MLYGPRAADGKASCCKFHPKNALAGEDRVVTPGLIAFCAILVSHQMARRTVDANPFSLGSFPPVIRYHVPQWLRWCKLGNRLPKGLQ